MNNKGLDLYKHLLCYCILLSLRSKNAEIYREISGLVFKEIYVNRTKNIMFIFGYLIIPVGIFIGVCTFNTLWIITTTVFSIALSECACVAGAYYLYRVAQKDKEGGKR